MPKDRAKASKPVSKVIFENDRVRVVKMKLKKGDAIEMHKHGAYFAFAITPFEYKSISPGGKSEKRVLKKNQVDWRERESHAVEALRAGRALVVELK